jgi:hypothetical protein
MEKVVHFQVIFYHAKFGNFGSHGSTLFIFYFFGISLVIGKELED